MVENDNSMGYTLGHLRMKYLNEADNCYTRGGIKNYLACKRILQNFLQTIKEESDVSKLIKLELDKMNNSKKQLLMDLDLSFKNAGILEVKGMDEEKEIIEVNYIHDMKCLLWNISLEHGLFYERA